VCQWPDPTTITVHVIVPRLIQEPRGVRVPIQFVTLGGAVEGAIRVLDAGLLF